MGDRCTGHCCRQFLLPFTPAEAQERATRLNDPREQELADMLIQLEPPDTTGKTLYTCRNLRENGDCAIYENRPPMCADYPYGRACTNRDCTWDAARAGCAGKAMNHKEEA